MRKLAIILCLICASACGTETFYEFVTTPTQLGTNGNITYYTMISGEGGGGAADWTDPNASNLLLRLWNDPTATNGAGLVNDSSGNDNDSTPYPTAATGPAWTIIGTNGDSRVEHDYDYDGADDFNAGSSTDFATGTGAMSIGAWVKFDAVNTGTAQTMMRMKETSGQANDHTAAGIIEDSGSMIVHWRSTGGTLKFAYQSGAATNTWYYISGSKNASGGGTGYVNGVAMTTAATFSGADFNYQGTPFWYIGASSLNDGGASTLFLDGQIDDVVIYDKVITQSAWSNRYYNTRKPNNSTENGY